MGYNEEDIIECSDAAFASLDALGAEIGEIIKQIKILNLSIPFLEGKEISLVKALSEQSYFLDARYNDHVACLTDLGRIVDVSLDV